MKLFNGVLFLSFMVPFCVLAQENIPFLYLNQYFTYEVQNASRMTLDGKVIDLEKFEVTVTQDKALVTFESLENWILPTSLFIFKNSKNEIISKSKVSKSTLTMHFKLPATATSACLMSTSHFSKFEVCKQLNSVESEAEISVKVDGQQLDTAGSVVLKEKAQAVFFEAHFGTGFSVTLNTKKRSIIPISIQKNATDDFFSVRFRDTNLREANSWDDKINIDQSSVTIQLDPVVSLRQDLYFKNPNVKTRSMNFTKAESKVIVKKILNREIKTEVFGVYLGLRGSSATMNVSLNIDLGRGFQATYQWLIDKKMHGYVQGNMYQTTIVVDANTSVGNASQTLYSAAAGVNYHWLSQVDFIAEVRLQRDLFFATSGTSPTGVDMVGGLNKVISVIPVWSFYQNEKHQAWVDAGLHYLMSTTAENISVNSGLKYQLGLGYASAFQIGKFSAQVHYQRRDQNIEGFTFYENAAHFGLGYHYQF